MRHEPPNIIQELEFVLTHPSCNASVLEKFYNNWLYVNETVPLFAIIDYMRKEKPILLEDWSKINKTVRSLLIEIEPIRDGKSDEAAKKTITIHIDLTDQTPAQNGIFQVLWETDLEEPVVNAHFKSKSLLVIDKLNGNVELVGISQIEVYRYHLYVKKGRKVK